MLLLLIPMFTHTSAIPIVLEQNGLDIQKITSVTVAANCFTVIFINWLTVNGRLALPPRVNFIVSTLLLCLGLAAIPKVHTIALAVCSTIIWSSGEALLFPLLTSILFQAFPRHQAGLASGVKVLLVRVSLVITPLIGSMLVGRPPWIFAPVFIGLCLVGFLFSFPTLRHLETGILERRETNKVSESAGVVTK